MQIRSLSKNIVPVIVILAFGLLLSAYIYITYMSQPPSESLEARLAGTSTGILTGKDLSIDGDTIAFTTDAHELNGDRLISGPVIRYYTISTGEVTNTEALGWLLSLDDNIIAFEYRESETSVDLNGDGDTADRLISYYDISTGEVTNTGVMGVSPSLDGNMVAFHTPESEIGLVGADLNEDGDLEDYVVRCYDISTGTVRSIGMGGDPSLDGNLIAFYTHEEFDAGGVDLNGDGDIEDYVIRYYDMSTGTLTNTGIVSSYPLYQTPLDRYAWEGAKIALDGDTIAFETHEDDAGEDLNGDGDIEDSIIRYYDISTGTVTNTGITTGYWSLSLDGNTIAFNTGGIRSEYAYSIGYYDISTGTVTWVMKGVWGMSVEGNTVAFSILEQSQFGVGMDLNGDGDTEDSVIGYYVIGVDEPAEWPT